MKKLSIFLLILAVFSVGLFAGTPEKKTEIRRISNPPSLGPSFLIVSKQGTVLALDPFRMPKAAPWVDGIAVTHNHYDHNDPKFLARALQTNSRLVYINAPGSYAVKEIKVTGIASTHDAKPLSETGFTNTLMLIEVDGLRIVHMGDIGQDALTPEQLKALGHIDIALMQLKNSYSDVNMDNKKAFHMLDQLKPQIVIPTHTSTEATEYLGQVWGGLTRVTNVLEVSPEDLKGGSRKAIELL